MKAIFAALLLLPMASQAGMAKCTIQATNHIDSGVKVVEKVIDVSAYENVEFCVDGIRCSLAIPHPGKGSLLECSFDATGNYYIGSDRRSLEEAEPTNRIAFGVNGRHYDVVSTCTVKE